MRMFLLKVLFTLESYLADSNMWRSEPASPSDHPSRQKSFLVVGADGIGKQVAGKALAGMVRMLLPSVPCEADGFRRVPLEIYRDDQAETEGGGLPDD